MEAIKTRSIKKIEEAMASKDASSMRYQVLENAKNFKTSWMGLGQALYAVWKDKLYKDWGFGKFDTYTAKEIGIRKQTALKLLKSYYFLEKEEPSYLKKDQEDVGKVPTFESVDVLRLAKGRKTLDNHDYARIKEGILGRGKDAREAKKDLTQLMKSREELEPEEAWRKKRTALLKRYIGVLRSIRNEVSASKMLPAQIGKDAEKLIHKLELELK